MPAFGWIPQTPDHRDWTLVDPHSPTRLPAKFSLRESPYMPAIYNQTTLGSCTANAIASAYEFEFRRQLESFPNMTRTPSRLWIYYQERLMEGTVDQDAGAQVRDGLKVVGTVGVCPETDWPYDVNTFTGPPPEAATASARRWHATNYWSLSSGFDSSKLTACAPLRACLAAGFPFVLGFNVPPAFEYLTSQDPYLSLPSDDEFIGGHAVKAIGYDWTCTRFPTPVFEIKNSWGSDWGDHGYFFMDYRFFDQLASDLWTIRAVV